MKLKKAFLILLLVMVACPVSIASVNESGVTARVDIYSSREAPEWTMDLGEINQLKEKLNNLTVSEVISMPPDRGYIIITNKNKTLDFPYYTVYLYRQKVMVIGFDGNKSFYSDLEGIASWMVELGNEHDPRYVPPKYKSLPPNTSHIEIISKNLMGVSSQNKKLVKRITIFSEGTGELIGAIKVPDFVNANETSFRLAPIESGKDFFFEIDTNSTGNLSGDLIIESNDPENGTIILPMNFQIYESTLDLNETSNIKTSDGTDYSVFVIFAIPNNLT